jgi:hypothetical protein
MAVEAVEAELLYSDSSTGKKSENSSPHEEKST